MKRCLCMLLAVVLLLACVNIAPITAHAAKAEKKRAIAVVFDNSASMYKDGDKTWCRATYAMEVFASMLNDKDVLNIYPMNPIEVNGKTYSMDAPLTISNPKEATEKVHNIFSPHSEPATRNTPIESIDRAIAGLEQMSGDERHLIILTDGDVFYENNKDLSKSVSRSKLESRIQTAVGKSGITKVWYLGIKPEDVDVIMPDINSPKFYKEEAKESTEILSILTEMCNGIFGRDLLPSGYLSGKNVKFDVSVKNVFVFVQGTDIANLQLKDKNGKEVAGKPLALQPKFSTKGSGLEAKYNANTVDESLQGMIVKYAGCEAGEYTVSFSGTANAQNGIQVYYEPDVDMYFEFTTASGKEVDLDKLYEGTYTVKYGLKDEKTGDKIEESKLLGTPAYTVSYTHKSENNNGEKETLPVTTGISGQFSITLNVGDTFEADLVVTYLKDYTITKSSSEFGFPKGGVKVVARPAADLSMKIEGGQDVYSLQKLPEGAPYKLTFFYGDKQLTGADLEAVFNDLEIGHEYSNAKITKTLENDHILLSLGYQEGDPKDTKEGSCTVPITAYYTAKGSTTAQTSGELEYYIENDFSPLMIDLYAQESYVVIAEMDTTPPLIADLLIEGKPLTAEQFAAVQASVDIGGVPYELKPDQENSRYLIYLKQEDGVQEGDYIVKFTATYTDNIGETTTQEDEVAITLSTVALWKKVLNWIIWILLGIILLIMILRIRVFPSPVKTRNSECELNYDNDTIDTGATFTANRSGKQLQAVCGYNGDRFGIALGNIEPGKKSFLCKSSKKRTILLKMQELKKVGPAEITDVNVAGILYELDDNGKLVPMDPGVRTRELRNGEQISFSGTIEEMGVPKEFSVSIKVNYKK